MFDTSDDRGLLHSFVRTKDDGAFAELVRRHEGMMRAVAGEIRAEPSVGPWLHRAATLEGLAVRRQRVKRSIREKEAVEHQQRGTAEMPSETAAELDEAITVLSATTATRIAAGCPNITSSATMRRMTILGKDSRA